MAKVSWSRGYSTFESVAAETLGISRRECHWCSECSRLAKQDPRLGGHESFGEINSFVKTYR